MFSFSGDAFEMQSEKTGKVEFGTVRLNMMRFLFNHRGKTTITLKTQNA